MNQAIMFEVEPAAAAPVYTSFADKFEADRRAERLITEAFYQKMAEVAALISHDIEWPEGHDTYAWAHPVRLIDRRHPGRAYGARLYKGRIEIHGHIGPELSDHMRHGGDYGDEYAEAGMSASRSAKEIAGEIYSRIYKPYLALLQTLEERKAAHDADNARKRELGRRLEAAGGPGAQYEEKQDGRAYIKVKVTNGHRMPWGSGTPRADAEVITYDRERVEMKLTDLPMELAEEIMRLVGEYTS